MSVIQRDGRQHRRQGAAIRNAKISVEIGVEDRDHERHCPNVASDAVAETAIGARVSTIEAPVRAREPGNRIEMISHKGVREATTPGPRVHDPARRQRRVDQVAVP